jgi:hypothetical protein
MKQTAVEWLENQLKLRANDWIEVNLAIEQAKEMEKQQIKFAYNDGYTQYILEGKYKPMQKYYNENYGENN